MARTTMGQVAAAAGVSGQTVSRVVNGSPRVDPATRARVEAAMERLGYRPHRAARALRTGRTQTIGLVASTFASVGNARMLEAVTDAASAHGFAVVVVTAQGRDGVARAFERIADQGVDGAVVLNEATAAARGVPTGLRLVVVDAPADAAGHAIVQTDHAAGARAATQHLLGLGHATVWHVAGPAGSFAAAERERGWRDALTAAGAPVPAPTRGDWSAASGRAALAAVPSEATAVFCANDQMALGALHALADAGRRVPGDVAVVGFDDVADAADYLPPLTTVRQRFDVLGARAFDALVRMIGGEPPTVDLVAPELIVRESSGRD